MLLYIGVVSQAREKTHEQEVSSMQAEMDEQKKQVALKEETICNMQQTFQQQVTIFLSKAQITFEFRLAVTTKMLKVMLLFTFVSRCYIHNVMRLIYNMLQ